MTQTLKPSTEFEKFDQAMDKIMSVSKQEMDKRIKAAKNAKTGKRYPKAHEVNELSETQSNRKDQSVRRFGKPPG